MTERPPLLSPDALRAALTALPGWEWRDDALHKEWDFGDFGRACGFLVGLAVAAAELDHHPDWSGVYGRVRLGLSTHDAGGVTELDLELARRAEALADPS